MAQVSRALLLVVFITTQAVLGGPTALLKTEGERKYQTDLGPLELQDIATKNGVQEMFVIAEGRDHLEKQVDTKRTLTLQTPALVLTFAAIVFFWVQVVLLDYCQRATASPGRVPMNMGCPNGNIFILDNLKNYLDFEAMVDFLHGNAEHEKNKGAEPLQLLGESAANQSAANHTIARSAAEQTSEEEADRMDSEAYSKGDDEEGPQTDETETSQVA